MTRTQKILSGLIILQFILAAVVFWPREAAAVESGPLFAGWADLDPAEIMHLTITDNEGNVAGLQRQGDGWVLASGGNYPADAAKIDPILARIMATQTNRQVTTTAGSHKQLQVADDDFVRRVELETGSGETYTFYMGSTAAASATHVRRAGDDPTYLVNDLTVWEITPTASNWIDAEYVALDRNGVTAVSLQNANGTFTFDKIGDEEWTLADLAEGESFNQGNFNLILNRVVSMRLTQPLGTELLPEYGLDSPQATLTVSVEENNASSTYTLEIGAALEDGSQVIKWSGSDYYVTITPFMVENMVNFGRGDFVTAPSTDEAPATEETPTSETP